MDAHPKTDEELMHEYAQGDAQALSLLFSKYKEPVFNFCLRILRNRSEAEDVTSETFMALLNKKYVRQSSAKFSTWLYTIARNTSISRIRKKQKLFSLWTKNKEGQDTLMDVVDTTPLIRDEMESRQKNNMLEDSLKRLPTDLKEALVLREFHDLSYEDIAQVLGCSLAKVKILIFRAREVLRQKFLASLKEETL